MFDGKAFGDEIVGIVKGFVARSLEPLAARLAALEQREPVRGEKGDRGEKGEPGERGPTGKDGAGLAGALIDQSGNLILTLADGTTKDVGRIIGRDGARGDCGEPGQNGKDAPAPTADQITAALKAAPDLTQSAVRDYLTANPPPAGKDGRDGRDGEKGQDGKDAPPPTQEQVLAALTANPDLMRAAIAEYMAANPAPAGKDGRDGKDAEPITREQLIEAVLATPDVIDAAVARHLAANPPPTGRDGRDGKDGAKGADGRDGVSLAGALIDRDGKLVVTLSDGTTRELGTVVGQDGKDGAPGQKGEPGKDGRDGVGFDDMAVQMSEDERTLSIVCARGENRKEWTFRLSHVLDRGVFKADTKYAKGDGVTWGGSFWIAQRDTETKPGEGPDWRLSVKKGRDGKDGMPGPKGDKGDRGLPGEDKTHLKLT